MKAAWRVQLNMGGELSDNALWRVRELIRDAVEPIAAEYLADLTVTPEWSIPGIGTTEAYLEHARPGNLRVVEDVPSP